MKILFIVIYFIAVMYIENDIRWNWRRYNRMKKWEMLIMQFCPVINVLSAYMIWCKG